MTARSVLPEPGDKARAVLAEGAENLRAAKAVLEGVTEWRAGPIQEALMAWADEAGIKRKQAFEPVRAAVTGSLISPPLFESMEVLGRETAMRRIAAAAG